MPKQQAAPLPCVDDESEAPQYKLRAAPPGAADAIDAAAVCAAASKNQTGAEQAFPFDDSQELLGLLQSMIEPGGAFYRAVECLVTKRLRKPVEPFTNDELRFLCFIGMGQVDWDERQRLLRISEHVKCVLEHQRLYREANHHGDKQAIEREAAYLRRAAPPWLLPMPGELCPELRTVERRIAETRVRLSACRAVLDLHSIEPRVVNGEVIQERRPPQMDDARLLNFCNGLSHHHPAFPQAYRCGGFTAYKVDAAAWPVLCRELRREAEQIEPELAALEAQAAQWRAGAERDLQDLASIYIPNY